MSETDISSSVPSLLNRRECLRTLGALGAVAFLPGLRATSDPVTAPSTLTGTQPGFYRFRIGAFEALALHDGAIGGTTDKVPWIGAPPAKVAADLAAAALPVDRFEIPFQVLLVRMGTELVLVDTGGGPLFGPAAGRLRASLAAAGVQPEQITAVILTHAHRDHFGGLLDPQTRQPVFSHARHFIHRKEYDFWTGSAPDLSALPLPEATRRETAERARVHLQALDGRWEFIAPGDALLGGLEVVDAPGHTPGHLALLFSSGRDQLLHIADVALHHALSFANPDWHYTFDTLPDQAVVTRRKLLDRAAADRLRLFGAHMPFPALGYVRKQGDHYEHVIEPWVSL